MMIESTDSENIFSKIAGFTVKIRGDRFVSSADFSRFSIFPCKKRQQLCDLEISFFPRDLHLGMTRSSIPYDGVCQWEVCSGDSGKTSAYIRGGGDHKNETILVVESREHWREVAVYYPEKQSHFAGLCDIAGVIFRNRVVSLGGIIIHSSTAVKEGAAIVFTAPAGVGKSTQANLWRDLRGAMVLNDDSPCLKIEGDKVVAYGTPWSGSTDVYVNSSAQVAAIVVLEQAHENEITMLDASKASLHVLPRFFLPYQDVKLMDMALPVASAILSSVPVYHLKCRPDEGAVELVEQCLGL